MITRGGLGVGAVALVLAFAGAAGAAEAAIDAHGSVEQVYATGLAPSGQASLLNRSGRTVATGHADSLGGLLFRDVKPGTGYRVRPEDGDASGPLTVLSTQPAPPSTDVYKQSIPSSGYGYLTTRDGTKLAMYVHPPQDISDAATSAAFPPPPPQDTSAAPPPDAHAPPPPGAPPPTLIESSGYGYAAPAG